jgi:hypothetical protein
MNDGNLIANAGGLLKIRSALLKVCFVTINFLTDLTLIAKLKTQNIILKCS